MPQFVLSHGSPEGAKTYRALSSVAQGIVECMFFTAANGDNEGEEDLTQASVAELAPCALERLRTAATHFEELCGSELLDRACTALIGSNQHIEDVCDARQAIGRDVWYDGQGHGVGFSDRNSLMVADADLLSEHAKSCVSEHWYLYRGDDGSLYIG